MKQQSKRAHAEPSLSAYYTIPGIAFLASDPNTLVAGLSTQTEPNGTLSHKATATFPKKRQNMTYETAIHLHRHLASTKHVDLLRDLERSAITYAHLRASWAQANPEERLEIDPTRTAAHNSLIDGCNILARSMSKSGEDTAWRETLGNDRKSIGDFACYIHCVRALSAR